MSAPTPEWMNDAEVKADLSEKFPEWKPKGGNGGLVAEYIAPNLGSSAPGTAARKRRYAEDALADECAELAAMGKDSGRNSRLNTSAFKMSRYVHHGWIDEATVKTALRTACATNGVLAEDGEAQFLKTFSSGLEDGARLGEPVVNWHSVDPDVQIVTNIDGLCFDENDCPVSPDEVREQLQAAALAAHREKVASRAYDYRVSDEAKKLYNSQRVAEQGQQSPPLQLLTDMLLVPDEDATYRIGELLPTGGRALLAAQYKAGKTSLMGNLIKSLADGTPFLGRFEIEPTTRVTLIDTELDERMLRRWLREVGITKTNHVAVISLRGKLSTFDILDDDVRAQWAQKIFGSDFIVLDCLRPCLDALGLDENKEAGRFLVAFDELCAEAGSSEAVMVHHMGHQNSENGSNEKERSRGDSRLLDWPDVLWKIVRNNEDENDDSRYFSAMGRDVSVPEARLLWNPEDRSLFIRDGSRSDVSAANAIPDIVDFLSHPQQAAGVGQNAIERAMKPFGHGRNRVRSALRQATQSGALVVADGPRESKLYAVNPSYGKGEDEE